MTTDQSERSSPHGFAMHYSRGVIGAMQATLLRQILLFGVVPSALVVSIVGAIDALRAKDQLTAASGRVAAGKAIEAAALVSAANEDALDIVQTLSLAAETTLFGHRKKSMQLLYSTLESHPEYEGICYGYEPNADGQDSLAIELVRSDHPDALPAESLSDSGRLIPYYFRDNANQRGIGLKPLSEMETAEWYQEPLKRFKAFRSGVFKSDGRVESHLLYLTEPYDYEGVPMTSAIGTIVINGEFAGVSGLDLSLVTQRKNLVDLARSSGLNVMLLSDQGNFIAGAVGDPHDDGSLARAMEAIQLKPIHSTPWATVLPEVLAEKGGNSISFVQNPITGQQTLHAAAVVATGGWSVVVEVPASRLAGEVWSQLRISLIVGGVGVTLMLVLLLRMAVKLSRRIRVAASAARDVADGDLTRSYEVQGMDEAGELLGSMNDMTRRLNDLVCRVRGVTLNISGTATQMSGSSRQQEEVAQSFGSSSSEIAAAVRQISTTGSELLKNMERLAVSAGESSQMAVQGREGLQAMGKTMDELASATGGVADRLAAINEKARSINAIVDTITKVADQTNLLSVNAAIEAEKAGASGRGFLVVAREIRRLADQTAAATLDIETTVQQMQTAVSGGVMEMDRFRDQVHRGVDNVATVGQCLTQVIDRVGMAEGQFAQVTEGMQSQVQGAQQIRQSMDALAQNASRAREATAEFAQAATTLQDSLTQLRAAVGLFRLRDAT